MDVQEKIKICMNNIYMYDRKLSKYSESNLKMKDKINGIDICENNVEPSEYSSTNLNSKEGDVSHAEVACEQIGGQKRLNWIDCAKTVAIIAVVVDHCNGFCYINPIFAQMSYFSVSLFILLSGISTGLSFPRRKPYMHQLKRCGALFGQYAVAVLIIQAYYLRSFDLKTYISHVLNFDIQGPFYFLVFFFQLVLISPFLMDWYAFCRRQKICWLWHSVTLALIGYLSHVFIQKTYILPVHGGGQYLFGGTYILLFYIGILLSNRANFQLKTMWERLGSIAVTAILGIIWVCLRVQGKLPFDNWMSPYWGGGFNPPSAELIIYALIVLLFLFAVFTSLDGFQNGPVKIIINILCFAGKNTLFVFMYHLLVKDILINCFPVLNNNIWLRRWIVFNSMIIFPVIGVSIGKKCRKKFYDYLKENYHEYNI